MTKLSELFGQSIESYQLAFRFIILALPLALVPVLAEALQHFAEFQLGMFALEKGDSFSDQKQAIRLVFGAVKALSIFFIILVLPRFFLKNCRQKSAISFSKKNVSALFMGLIMILVMMLWVFWLGPILISFLLPSLSKLNVLLLLLLSPFLAAFVFSKSYNNWVAGLWDLPSPSAAQNKEINKALYGLGFIVQAAAIFPAMALHYWLGFNAMGAAGFTLATILIIDSVVVGILACLMASCIFVLFRDTYGSALRDKF